ncbi:hypothetical protein XELAEV_18040896mg [Xenopus laevis]|uniref:Uncharacterized protein n=1 Tax=Xenopus laevis TaxID=8355 RepID=A0A974CAD6_XENLA|nr:hypothetical protein XELAEV_18040896mg [Xenopus laevis]
MGTRCRTRTQASPVDLRHIQQLGVQVSKAWAPSAQSSWLLFSEAVLWHSVPFLYKIGHQFHYRSELVYWVFRTTL